MFDMIDKEVLINGRTYRLTLTEQIMAQVERLKSLYAQAYEDPEGFEQISSEIAEVVAEISGAVSPEASDSDMDGIVQEIIRTLDHRKAEVEKQLNRKKW